MTAHLDNITFYAEDPAALARFWCAVMGYPEPTGYPPELEQQLRGAGLGDDDLAARGLAWDDDPRHPRFYFHRYRHERRMRNRIHLDISPFEGRRATTEELRAERDRLIALGATEEKTVEGHWGPIPEFAIMMRDPEGNEFCLQ